MCELLCSVQLEPGLNSRNFKFFAGTKTWGFYQVLMYRLVAPCLLPGDDWYKGKFCILNWLVVKEIYMNGLE